MHCHLLHMYERFHDIGHCCQMDNLLMSVGLAREAYLLPTGGPHSWSNLEVKVLCSSMCDARGEDWKDSRDGAGYGKNDIKSCDLFVVFCYDQKLLFMISHSIKETTWVECKKKNNSQALKKFITFKFLSFNISHDYNFKTNDNNFAT